MLMRQTILYLPAQLLGPLAQMIAAIVWTYWLGPAALGVYAIAWAVQEFASVFVLAWWSAYVLRYASSHDGPADRERLNAMEIAVQAIAAIVQAIIVVAAAWLVIDIAPAPGFIAATVAFTLSRNISSHFGDRARAQFQTLPYSILQIVGSLFGLLLGLLAVQRWEPTPEALLWCYALAQTAGLILALPLMRLRLRRPHFEPALLRAAARYGLPLLLSSVLGWVATHAIRLVVQADMGIEAVGYVTVGWWLGLRLTTFASLLVTGASFSIAVEKARIGGAREALPQLATNGALLLGVLAPSVVGAIVLNVSFVHTLVAAQYADITAQILPWAVATGAIRAFKNHGSDQSFLVFERTTLNIWSTMLEAGLTVILCWIGLHWGGLTGAVIGCCAAAALSEAVSCYVAWSRFGYALRLGDLARIALATVAMAGILVLLPPARSLGELFLDVAAGAATYGLVILLAFPMVLQSVRGRLMRLATR